MRISSLISAIVLSSFLGTYAAAEFTVEKTDRGVTVKLDGQLFTEYVITGAKPILWPIIGPNGKPITRAYPMIPDVADETDKDHPHQKSLWFTHGNVNGVDFWAETPGHGSAKHKEYLKVAGGKEAVISTANDWVDKDGKEVLEDTRTVTLGADAESRWIDYDITLKASNGPVTFGDTKEGSFGVRTASSIRVDSKKGGVIVNSAGLKDKDAWGKTAPWVDYHGPVGDEQMGIAILNHPTSFRYPTYWHVRTYGLFAANPWGVKDFTKSGDGAYTLPAGESITLRYRVIFHKGDEKVGKIAEAFSSYSQLPKK